MVRTEGACNGPVQGLFTKDHSARASPTDWIETLGLQFQKPLSF